MQTSLQNATMTCLGFLQDVGSSDADDRIPPCSAGFPTLVTRLGGAGRAYFNPGAMPPLKKIKSSAEHRRFSFFTPRTESALTRGLRPHLNIQKRRLKSAFLYIQPPTVDAKSVASTVPLFEAGSAVRGSSGIKRKSNKRKDSGDVLVRDLPLPADNVRFNSGAPPPSEYTKTPA